MEIGYGCCMGASIGPDLPPSTSPTRYTANPANDPWYSQVDWRGILEDIFKRTPAVGPNPIIMPAPEKSSYIAPIAIGAAALFGAFMLLRK